MKWSQAEINFLQESYGIIKIDEIELYLSRTRSSIWQQAKKLGLRGNTSLAHRKYSFDENFFNIPTTTNAYWAGVLAADGCISDTGNIQIAIATKDRELLEEFKKAAKYTGPILETIYKGKPRVSIAIWGAKKWKTDLYAHWNITPRKSLTLQPPSGLLAQFIMPYIIGYFDGDGTASLVIADKKTQRKKFIFGFVGTNAVLSWIKSQLDALVPSTGRQVSVTKPKKKKYCVLHYSGQRGIRIHNHLRIIPTAWKLPRKWRQR